MKSVKVDDRRNVLVGRNILNTLHLKNVSSYFCNVYFHVRTFLLLGVPMLYAGCSEGSFLVIRRCFVVSDFFCDLPVWTQDPKSPYRIVLFSPIFLARLEFTLFPLVLRRNKRNIFLSVQSVLSSLSVSWWRPLGLSLHHILQRKSNSLFLFLLFQTCEPLTKFVCRLFRDAWCFANCAKRVFAALNHTFTFVICLIKMFESQLLYHALFFVDYIFYWQ